jgi:hypothetical protein
MPLVLTTFSFLGGLSVGSSLFLVVISTTCTYTPHTAPAEYSRWQTERAGTGKGCLTQLPLTRCWVRRHTARSCSGKSLSLSLSLIGGDTQRTLSDRVPGCVCVVAGSSNRGTVCCPNVCTGLLRSKHFVSSCTFNCCSTCSPHPPHAPQWVCERLPAAKRVLDALGD